MKRAPRKALRKRSSSVINIIITRMRALSVSVVVVFVVIVTERQSKMKPFQCASAPTARLRSFA